MCQIWSGQIILLWISRVFELTRINQTIMYHERTYFLQAIQQKHILSEYDSKVQMFKLYVK